MMQYFWMGAPYNEQAVEWAKANGIDPHRVAAQYLAFDPEQPETELEVFAFDRTGQKALGPDGYQKYRITISIAWSPEQFGIPALNEAPMAGLLAQQAKLRDALKVVEEQIQRLTPAPV